MGRSGPGQEQKQDCSSGNFESRHQFSPQPDYSADLPGSTDANPFRLIFSAAMPKQQ
jgi:hypothetical protein